MEKQLIIAHFFSYSIKEAEETAVSKGMKLKIMGLPTI